MARQRSVGRLSHHVGERAAAINEELPLGHDSRRAAETQREFWDELDALRASIAIASVEAAGRTMILRVSAALRANFLLSNE
jgi:hypothetical protein